MAVADDIARVESKVDTVVDTVGEMNTCVTQLATRLENYPKKVEQIDDHEVRLTAMEALEVQKYSSRLQRVENSIASFKGWLAGATAVAAAVGALVAWLLGKILTAPPPT